jgi:hypothetical protein
MCATCATLACLANEDYLNNMSTSLCSVGNYVLGFNMSTKEKD